MPMHDMVRSSFQTRIIGPLRRSSFAGDGLPERMRSTAVVFLGLTAAMGLALVAIFAQINFSVLSPVPLPSGPSAGSSVAKAVVVDHQSRPAIARTTVGTERPANGPAARGAGGPGTSGLQADQGGVAPPASTSPEQGETSGNEPAEGPVSGSPSAPSAEPAPSPAPAASPAKKPTPTPATPGTPAPAPGNSQSTAAAAHASERGVEASSKQSSPSSSAKAAASAAEQAGEASPGGANGRAVGHNK